MNVLGYMLQAAIDWTWLADHWIVLASAVVVILGLLVVGFRDLGRFSLKRAWAISGVCFAESMRKRVLLIIPLAIIGVIIIAQLQRAIDVEDAVRQTIRSCIFAVAIVVTITSIILACTNLPKEIESKVIFTIVTKPATRLELILGKIIGFARVSLTIILMLGLFTWGYVRLRATAKNSEIARELSGGMIGTTERARLSHYADAGLLSGYSFWATDDLQMFGRQPDVQSRTRVISGDGGQDFVVRFPVDQQILFGPRTPTLGADEWHKHGGGETGLFIVVELKSKRTGAVSDQLEAGTGMGPFAPGTVNPNVRTPIISIQVLDQNRNSFSGGLHVIGASSEKDLDENIRWYMNNLEAPKGGSGESVRLSPSTRPSFPLFHQDPANSGDVQYAYAWVPGYDVQRDFASQKSFYVRVAGISQNVDFSVGERPVVVLIPVLKDDRLLLNPPDAVELPSAPGGLRFRGGIGTEGGQQLNGSSDPNGAVAIYTFEDAPRVSFNGNVPFQLTATVNRGGTDTGHEDPTNLDVNVVDLDNNSQVHVGPVQVESHEPTFFNIPASAISGKNFQVVIRCISSGHSIGLFPSSLQLEMGREIFEWTLIKSLSIVWMMSILVVVLAVMCSTFLSWPIAIVLTTLLLLGHWGVNQLSDVTQPGLGRQVTQDLGIGSADPALSVVVSSGVDALSHVLNYIAQALPDTERFDAIEDIAHGNSIVVGKLIQSLEILALFGLPALTLAYVIMKGKEVAP